MMEPQMMEPQMEVKTVEIQSEWVSDGLEPYFRNWVAYNPVLISAQTGYGKNHFILEKLIPYAIQTNQSVFILSNRVALGIQQKKALLKILKWPQRCEDSELQKMEDFGLIHVWSYQSALTRVSQPNLCPLYWRDGFPINGYLILDEAHFFLNDAPFNADTEQIFKTLTYMFKLYTRIYMTATPDNVKDIIVYYEQHVYLEERRLMPHWQFRGRARVEQIDPVTMYNFHRDFTNYNITFFTDLKHLYPKLKSASLSNKWLCFVNDKKRQAQIAKDLNLGPNLNLFNSSCKKDGNKVWHKLIKGEIPGNILLTTSVIDNGVNIIDPALHNIVIETTDKVSCLQMLGRKRRAKGETVNIFIQVATDSDIEKKLQQIEGYLRIIDSYYGNYNYFLQNEWPDLHDDVRQLFWVENGNDIQLNHFAHQELIYQHKFYSDLLYEMQQAPDWRNIYPNTVMEWLERPSEAIHWINESEEERSIDELIKFLNKYIPNGISVNEQEDFYHEFFRLASNIFYEHPKERDDVRSIPSTINRHLENLSDLLRDKYKIKKENNKYYIYRQKKDK